MSKIRGSPTSGLVMATFGFFVGFAAVSLYGPVAKKLKDILELGGLALGFLVAAPQLTGSLLRIPFGAWVDKVGGKRPLLTLLGLSIIGMGGLTVLLYLTYPDRLTSSFYPLILILGFLSGCAVATFSVGIPQTSYWFPQNKQGVALGTYAGLGNTAPGLFALLLPLAFSAWGLTGAYLAWFIFLFAGTIIYGVFVQDAPYFQLIQQGVPKEKAIEEAKQWGQELIPSGTLIEALKSSAKAGRTWGLVALYFTSFGGFLALTAWFPFYWSIYHGTSLKMAGFLTAVAFSLLASLVRVGGGSISDKIGGENTALLSFLTVLVGALVMIFSESFGPCLMGELLLGIGMGAGNAAVFKLVPKYVPEAVGGASGWVGGVGAFGGFVVPPILGSFADVMGKAGYAKGFVVYLFLALMCMVVTYVLKRTQKGSI